MTPEPYQQWAVDLCTAILKGVPPQEAAQKAVLAGSDREETRRLLQELDRSPLLRAAQPVASQLRARNWWFGAWAKLAALGGEAGSIDTAREISKERFLRNYYFKNRPLLMPGIAADWRAVRDWTENYLCERCGHAKVEIMTKRASALTKHQNTGDHLRTEVPFREYVKQVFQAGPSNDYYMVSRNRFFEQKDTAILRNDIGSLEVVNTSAPGDAVKMWFGPEGTITPLHYDDRNNVIVQVLGSKTVRLYAPFDSEFMAQPNHWYAGVDPGKKRGFCAASKRPDASEIVFTMVAGDALFIPVGWWHAIVANSPSITLAFVDFGVANSYPL